MSQLILFTFTFFSWKLPQGKWIHFVIWSLKSLSYILFYNITIWIERTGYWSKIHLGSNVCFNTYYVNMSKFLSHLLFGLFFVEWELIQVNLLNCGKSSVGEKNLCMCVPYKSLVNGNSCFVLFFPFCLWFLTGF